MFHLGLHHRFALLHAHKIGNLHLVWLSIIQENHSNANGVEGGEDGHRRGLLDHERQERHDTRTFDGGGKFPLMPSAHATAAGGGDCGVAGHKPSEQSRIFVIDV